MVVPLLPRCPICGKPYPCSVHRGTFPLISGNYHEGINREIVLELKYRNKAGLGRIMGMALSSAVKDVCGDILVPVPLHRKSRRNYNQAKLIAEGLSTKNGRPVEDILSWNTDVLSQVSRSPSERRKLSPDCMKCEKSELDGKEIILVDDVATTGTTLQICSMAIKRAGGRVTGAVTWTVSPF
jgi:ComF family protein